MTDLPEAEAAGWDLGGSPWLEPIAALGADAEMWPGGPTVRSYLDLHAPRPDPEGVVFESEVVYGAGGGRDLVLDLYRPVDTGERRPAVVFVHGGGWGGGDRWFHLRHCRELAALGYVTATIDYRLAGEAPWPAALEDSKCAVRWLRTHAGEVGADPERIAVAGGSAGAQLAALVALTPGRGEGTGGWAGTSSAVRCAVVWYPPSDIAACPWDDAARAALIEYFHGEERDASPVTHVHAGAPPMLTITGSGDTLTTFEVVRQLHDGLVAVGATSRLEVFEGREHAFDLYPADWQASFDLLAGFLAEHL